MYTFVPNFKHRKIHYLFVCIFYNPTPGQLRESECYSDHLISALLLQSHVLSAKHQPTCGQETLHFSVLWNHFPLRNEYKELDNLISEVIIEFFIKYFESYYY